MINSVELRIGNWVLDAGGNPIKVTPQRIADIDNNLVISNPIELTESLLLNNGFEKGANLSFMKEYKIKAYSIIIDDDKTFDTYMFVTHLVNNNEWTFGILQHGKSVSIGVLYGLHQLQNAFRVMSQNELEINFD